MLGGRHGAGISPHLIRVVLSALPGKKNWFSPMVAKVGDEPSKSSDKERCEKNIFVRFRVGPGQQVHMYILICIMTQ
jgi:hypothetical protein